LSSTKETTPLTRPLPLQGHSPYMATFSL
jgi:hypothetical protein